jgi:hypothetical protein
MISYSWASEAGRFVGYIAGTDVLRGTPAQLLALVVVA